jgi:hypothetical protein
MIVHSFALAMLSTMFGGFFFGSIDIFENRDDMIDLIFIIPRQLAIYNKQDVLFFCLFVQLKLDVACLELSGRRGYIITPRVCIGTG